MMWSFVPMWRGMPFSAIAAPPTTPRRVSLPVVVARWAGLCFFSLFTSLGLASSLYDDMIQRVALEERVDVNLLRAVVATESAFDPSAQSPKGAMGLMQLMPGTAKLMGVERPYNPEDNLRGGARYLRGLIDRFDRVDYALAGYNAGPENIVKYNGIPPFQETMDYVAKVRDNYSRQINGGGPTWRKATASNPVVDITRPAQPGKAPHIPKKIFVYRDARGTLVLTDIQPKQRANSVPAKVYINPASSRTTTPASIRISPPVRTLQGDKRDLRG
ncbi:MAG: lytic transglycosylase domain-containing protein [Magnetococcales bacterium]|nr:lytic transglycosylase domain-containing protein [Magnetococcales bacterium]NGZ25699.1 lytic transglycosylase domain-containing protein [Magnetococcales bacterium]